MPTRRVMSFQAELFTLRALGFPYQAMKKLDQNHLVKIAKSLGY